MNFQDRIKFQFSENIETIIATADTLPLQIEKAANIMVESILNGGKVFSCGCGQSNYESKRLYTYLIHQFALERPSLPAISLNSDIMAFSQCDQNNSVNNIFAKQINTYGQSDDVLVTFSLKGHSEMIANAIDAAVNKGLSVISITGDGQKSQEVSDENHHLILNIPSSDNARILEGQTLIINCICDIIEQSLFGHSD